jgi:hypothetical protein
VENLESYRSGAASRQTGRWGLASSAKIYQSIKIRLLRANNRRVESTQMRRTGLQQTANNKNLVACTDAVLR